MRSRNHPLPSFLRRITLVLALITLTVPWKADQLLSQTAGPLPLWVYYALAASTLLAIITSILAHQWWPDADHPESPSSPATPKTNHH